MEEEITQIKEITRGDTKSFKFQRRKKGTGEVITQKADKAFFTVKTSVYSKNYLFQKRLDNGISYNEQDNYYRFTIEPSDTDELDFDDYVFDIEVIANNRKKTISKGTLTVTTEVTDAGNEV